MNDDARPTAARRLSGSMLVIVVLAILALPPLLTLAVALVPTSLQRVFSAMQLSDNAGASARPPLTSEEWLQGKFQTRFEQWWNERLAPRPVMIRLTNQVYYSLFRRSPIGFIIGKEDHVFHPNYTKVYCEPPRPDILAHLTPLAIKVNQLQSELKRVGTPLVFVVSPSKPSALSEFLPPGLCPRGSRLQADTKTLVELLRAAAVPVIDGPALVEQMKRADRLPPFPRGGLHWSILAAKRIAVVLLEQANRTGGIDFGAMGLGKVNWNLPPRDSDRDVALMLNLYRPPFDYPTADAQVECHRTEAGQKTRLIAVGGSFLGNLLDPLHECRFFESMTQYFYYTQYRYDWPPRITPVDRSSLDWRALLAPPTLLLVELNDYFVEQEFPHLHEFLDDALLALRRRAPEKH